MFLKELKLNGFRNWNLGEFTFSPGLNVLCGNNAQGKTNCAEGVFFLCTGISPLASREKQVIAFDREEASVSGTAATSFGDVKVEIFLKEGKRKQIKVNGATLSKAGDLLGNVNAVFFNPDELKLIKDAPSDRRRFLDVAISQLKRPYFYELLRYNKILEQRNRLLKEEDEETVWETLPVWDEQLAEAGSYIMVQRQEFCEKLAPYAKAAHAALTAGKEELVISPECKFAGDQKTIFYAFLQGLAQRREQDLRAGFTTVGPHRDDLKIEINGSDVKTYCSQGQKRSAALSIKLAELDIMRAETGEYPLFILDDVLSELDKDRQKRLLSKLSGVQTVLTATHLDEEVFQGLSYRLFTVDHGTYTVREEKG